MSLRKVRYFHNQNHREWCLFPFKGFTAKLTPSNEPGKVLLSVAFCSKHDSFCKKKGREVADKAIHLLVDVTQVPYRLAEFECFAQGYTEVSRNHSNEFAWIWKYFL